MASHFPRRHAPQLSYYYIAVKQRRLARIREIMHQHALKDMLDSGCQAMLAILKLFVTLISVFVLCGLRNMIGSNTRKGKLRGGMARTSSLRGYSPQSQAFTIFVLGTVIKSAAIHVSRSTKVSEILSTLRRRRLIADSRRISCDLLYPPYSMRPLSPQTSLGDMGICDLSTLHLRYCVRGGAPPAEGTSDTLAHLTRFTRGSGSFPRDADPRDWRPASKGYFRCLLCNKDYWWTHLGRHEKTQTHQRRKKLCLRTTHHGTSESSHHDTQHASVNYHDVHQSLVDVLSEVSSRDEPPLTEAHLRSPTGVVDWAAVSFQSGTEHAAPAQEIELQRLSAHLEHFLSTDVRVESSSDEEDNGGEDIAPADLSAGDCSFQTQQSAGLDPTVPYQRPLTDKDTPWFPWPDRETCVLDILRHIPRCAFSLKQNTVIHWALLALGIRDTPSERTIEHVSKKLQSIFGVASIRYKGAFGHIYYTNDFAAIVAQEMSNPRVRAHLHFLPEDAGQKLSETWQAARWLTELDPDLATPMLRQGHHDFYTLELTLLNGGQVCMPFRWFTRGSAVFARAWAM
ncbi:hypothetical protein C8Q72DRAFT_804114, partial [Fomitopsis betulina]